MSRFPKPCLICQRLSKERLCEEHMAQEKAIHEAQRKATKAATNQYGGNYHSKAKQIRETATHCHICGEGKKIDDPFEADHLIPAQSGNDAILLPAHRSCNRRRSNKPLS